jgi:DNA-binding NtrC family response regulator
MSQSILQVGYYPGLIETRRTILERDGYRVVSALGNKQGKALAGNGGFDLFIVGFSTGQSERTLMVRWLKKHLPKVPVVVLLANSLETFPDADFVTFSEDPQVWLAAVRTACARDPH